MTQTQPDGYLATPASGSGPGVLVLHAWWGVNDTIKNICNRLAENGFVAFAPDLYHGKVAATIPEAEALGRALDDRFAEARVEVADAAKYLRQRAGQDGLALMAFSLGVYYALDLAAAQPETIRKVVIFYGSGDGDYSQARAAYLGHFAENDPYESREYIDNLEQALKAAGRAVDFFTYPGTTHWFFEPERKDAYHEQAARLAWERTLAFLKR